jgi:hypothetical protein
MDITFFEPPSYISSSKTPLQGESKIEEDFFFYSGTYPYSYARAGAKTAY